MSILTFFILLTFGILTGIWYLFGQIPLSEVLFYVRFLDFNQITMFWFELLCLCILSVILTLFIKRFPKIMLLPTLCWVVWLGWIYLYPLVKTKNETVLFSENYILPQIKARGQKKNIILIFWESMENTFADSTVWGENLIPNMSKLEKEKLSFTGYQNLQITRSTIKSHVATLCGIPFLEQGPESTFLPSAKCLPDYLKEQGYYQVFMKAADTRYTDADIFAKTHSFNEVIGRQDFLKRGVISEEDKQRWGVYDSVFLKLAEQKLIELSQREEPFFLVLTTVNTHYPYGNQEKDCLNKYGDIRDSIKCSDKIMSQFILWLKEQKFFENTVVFIMGDHPMFLNLEMPFANNLNHYKGRNTFNAVINGSLKHQNVSKKYAQFDWAPTILELVGFTLSPRHFGLGVSLISPEKSVIEKYGQEKLEELIENSKADFENRFIKSDFRVR